MEQDFYEDYVNITKNKEPKQDETKIRSIIITAEKKKQSEEKAIKIVEFLTEGKIRPETFLKSLISLNSMYYQDVVEERAINKICGYPLCGNKIAFQLKNRYSISTKSNKVYDLNEYGDFCSIFCYNASNYIKNQMDDSPLWLREVENVLTFQLLPKDTGHSSAGVNVKIKQKNKDVDFIPLASFAEISLEDFGKSNIESKKNKEFSLTVTVKEGKKIQSKPSQSIGKSKEDKLCTVFEDINEEWSEEVGERNKPDSSLKDIKVNNYEYSNMVQEQKYSSKLETVKEQNYLDPKKVKMKEEAHNNHINETNLYGVKVTSKRLKAVNDMIKNKTKQPVVKIIDTLPLKVSVSVKGILKETNFQTIEKKKSMLNYENLDENAIKLKFSSKNSREAEDQLRRAFSNWISLDTLIFVHGESKVEEILNRKKLSDYFTKLKVMQLELTQQKRYIDICKKLQLQELLEEKWDNACTENKKLQPLPEYSKIKTETKELDLKVKSFYGGSLYEVDHSNFKMKESEESEGVPAVFPLVDVNSQNALRRRVLLTALNRGIKYFLDLIKYNATVVLSDLQDLVKTFKLSADNVVFKPVICDYLGLICLRILALRDNELGKALEEEVSRELEELIFDHLPTKRSVISDSLQLIEDMDSFVTNYIMGLGPTLVNVK